MDMNRLTQKSQEALQMAQSLATEQGHVEADGEHILGALLAQEDALLPSVLRRMEVSPETLTEEVSQELLRRPKASGPGIEAGRIYVTRRFQGLLAAAESEASRLKDEYVSVEHLVLALIDEGKNSAAGRIFASHNVTRDRFLQALTTIRGNQRVTSDNPEAVYEALEKYGIDLVAEAR